MDEIKMEREIKEMLHQCGDGLHAPDSMQARHRHASVICGANALWRLPLSRRLQ